MTGVLVGALLAVIAAAGALGSGDRQAREYLTRIERQYAAAKDLPWSTIRPVIRSTISPDDKLTAIVKVLKKTTVDPKVLPKFEEADRVLTDLHKYLRKRYTGLLGLSIYLLFLLFSTIVLPRTIALPYFGVPMKSDDLLLLLLLLPLVWILRILYKLGSLEVEFYSLYDRLEELL